MTRRIVLSGGVVLVTGDGARLLIYPEQCPTCRRKVTADGDRDHSLNHSPERRRRRLGDSHRRAVSWARGRRKGGGLMSEFALFGNDLFGNAVTPKASGPVAERCEGEAGA